jgi:hypothetical protein
MTTYTAWYDKQKGLFTIQNAKGVPVFKQLPVRSGQAGYLNAPWVRSMGAIPTNKEVGSGKLYIHTTPTKDPKGDLNNDGIGLFFPISDSLTRTDIIRGHNALEIRWWIGLHGENRYLGSAGCIVLLWNTNSRKRTVVSLYQWLQNLAKQGVKAIELKVF